jgi:hypothetical protein
MLSLRLWRELDIVPAYPLLHKVFIPNSPGIFPRFVVEFIAVIMFCLCTAFPFIVLPLVIIFSCLNMTLRIAATLAHQHELDRFELLSITPIGILRTAIDISRVHSKELREYIEIVRSFGGASVVFILNVSVLAFGISLNSTQPNSNNFALFVGLLGFLFVVVALYHDCRQSFILGVVIGILAGSVRERMTARVWALGGYVGIQLSLYVLLGLLFSLLIELFGEMRFLNVDLRLLGVIILVTLGHFSAREIVIRLLWRHLRQSLNDELISRFGKQKVGG